jgi:hypothetical protein
MPQDTGLQRLRILCARAPEEEFSPFLIQDPEGVRRLRQVQGREERLGPDFHLIQVGGHCDPIQNGVSIITLANAHEFDGERHVIFLLQTDVGLRGATSLRDTLRILPG